LQTLFKRVQKFAQLQPKAIPAINLIIHFSERITKSFVVSMPRPGCWLYGSGVIDRLQSIRHARRPPFRSTLRLNHNNY